MGVDSVVEQPSVGCSYPSSYHGFVGLFARWTTPKKRRCYGGPMRVAHRTPGTRRHRPEAKIPGNMPILTLGVFRSLRRRNRAEIALDNGATQRPRVVLLGDGSLRSFRCLFRQTLLVQPGEGALGEPAVTAQPGAVLGVAAGDLRGDLTLAQLTAFVVKGTGPFISIRVLRGAGRRAGLEVRHRWQLRV